MVDEFSARRNSGDTLHSDFPVALAELEVNIRELCFRWRVPACPICRFPHIHGAGSIGGGESPKAYLGHRAGHCRQMNRGYLLVDAHPADTARILLRVAARFDHLNGGLVRSGTALEGSQ